MPNYRRAHVPGGTVFLTIVTYQHHPLFANANSIDRLRLVLKQVIRESPFHIPAAVVLPDHIHFLWSLPQGDADFSRRVGRMKMLFTRSLRDDSGSLADIGDSRRRHRESNVWSRRFWEHTIEDEADFERHLDYIHYNPAKHGLVTCPHLWPFSSFARWVRGGWYTESWGCSCQGQRPALPVMTDDDLAGE